MLNTSVDHGTASLGSFTVDQTQTPDDTTVDGAGWVFLGELPRPA